jgi:hypothetical protein
VQHPGNKVVEHPCEETVVQGRPAMALAVDGYTPITVVIFWLIRRHRRVEVGQGSGVL